MVPAAKKAPAGGTLTAKGRVKAGKRPLGQAQVKFQRLTKKKKAKNGQKKAKNGQKKTRWVTVRAVTKKNKAKKRVRTNNKGRYAAKLKLPKKPGAVTLRAVVVKPQRTRGATSIRVRGCGKPRVS